jgi:hypothetical protein
MSLLILAIGTGWLCWLAYLIGQRHGERIGERNARHRHWQHDDERWLSDLGPIIEP